MKLDSWGHTYVSPFSGVQSRDEENWGCQSTNTSSSLKYWKRKLAFPSHRVTQNQYSASDLPLFHVVTFENWNTYFIILPITKFRVPLGMFPYTDLIDILIYLTRHTPYSLHGLTFDSLLDFWSIGTQLRKIDFPLQLQNPVLVLAKWTNCCAMPPWPEEPDLILQGSCYVRSLNPGATRLGLAVD